MTRRRRLIATSLVIVLSGITALFFALRGVSPGADATSVFSPVAPIVKASAGFPVLLPRYLPDDVMGQSVYAIVESATAQQYVVDFAYSSNCKGNTACSIGEVTGSTTALPLAGISTTLTNGAVAYFVNGTCKAYCAASTMTWHSGSAYYQVSMRGGDQATLTTIANDMGAY